MTRRTPLRRQPEPLGLAVLGANAKRKPNEPVTAYAEVMADIRAKSGWRSGKIVQKRGKYRNVRCEVDGEKFDSKAEAKRWQMLKILERAGAITGLRRQVNTPVAISKGDGAVLASMRWDFAYYDNGRFVLDDTKGMKATPEWRLKAKLCADMWPGYELRINGVRMK